VDEFCRVRDTDGHIFAAGDATDLPVKQGGVGAQQADTAAAGIAHLAGAAEAPKPLRPVIRGMLLTGRDPLYLAAHLIAGRGWLAQILDKPPWPADEKVVAEELGPYLDDFERSRPQPPAG
jgi:sulfide:quinone oxidoreductase